MSRKRSQFGFPLFGIPALVLSVFFVPAACGEAPSDATGPGFEVTDSAGVMVVRDATREIPLSVREILRVGVADGDPALQFHRTVDLAVDSAGGFWVVDGHPSVRHYDEQGRFVGAVGGSGEGPGETRGYFTVFVGDGRVLVTGSPGRIQLFGPDGTLLDSRPQRLDDGAFLRGVGHSDGRWVFMAERVERGSRGSVTATALAGDLSSVESFGTFPGRLYTARGQGPHILGNLSFAVNALGRFFVADSVRYRIELYGLDGALRRVVERPVPPTPVPEGFVAQVYEGVELALREGLLPDMPPRPQVDPDRVEQMASSAIPDAFPPYLPFIDGILAAPDGSFWVDRADRHPDPALRAVAHASGYVRGAWRPEWTAPRLFDLFQADGAYRGTVEFPADYAPMAVTRDRVYGVLYDELGVERILVYEVVEPEPARPTALAVPHGR